MPENNLSQVEKKRIKKYTDTFLQESPEIREAILKELPFENAMYNLAGRNHSFEALTLRFMAEKRGIDVRKDVLFDYKFILPPCPFCHEENNIRREKQKNTYYCKTCKKKYASNWNSITSGANVDAFCYLKCLLMMCEQRYSIKEISDACGITPTTFMRIRDRLFYAMHLQLTEYFPCYLSGNIEIDHMYVRASYKSMNLKDPADEYPEGSLYDDVKYIPREGKKRGGAVSMKDKNQNSCCIFVATDSRHVYAKFIGLGTPTANRIKNKVDTDLFLKSVPETDSFPYQIERNNSNKAIKIPGENSLFIFDKEAALQKFAKSMDFPYESHVYRKNNIQLKLPEGAHHIQHANRVCRDLRKFIANSNTSSRMLPGIITFYLWLENTGGGSDSIHDLFDILTRPGLGEFNDDFFDAFFSVPNYYVQLLDEENPLSKLSYNTLLMYYLYALRMDKLNAGLKDEVMPMKEICDICGCTDKTVRKNYKKLNSSGFDELIRNYFISQQEPTSLPDNKTKNNSTENIIINSQSNISAEALLFYDDWIEILKREPGDRPTREEFLILENKKYNCHLTASQIRHQFSLIQKNRIRPTITEIKESETKKRQLRYLEEYKQIYNEYLSKGITPKVDDIYAEIAHNHGLKPRTISDIFNVSRKVCKIKEELYEMRH